MRRGRSGNWRGEPGFTQPNPDSRYWDIKPKPMPHLCRPFRFYMDGMGPGTRHHCQGQDCRAVWEAVGIQFAQYPTDGTSGRDGIAGPEYWRFISGTEKAKAQEPIYDFRDPSAVLLQYLIANGG